MNGHEISATEPDWGREAPQRFWDPSRRLLRAIRGCQGARNRVSLKWWHLCHRFWSVITQTDISPQTRIGGGLLLPHPNGVVIHPNATIGPNCLIFQQVTIGVTLSVGAPQIGGHVDIGAGARILGPVRIGNHVQIGANSVVTCDVPDGTIARGIPARIYPGETS